MILYKENYKKTFSFSVMCEKFSLNKQKMWKEISEVFVFQALYVQFWKCIFLRKQFWKFLFWGRNFLKEILWRKILKMYFFKGAIFLNFFKCFFWGRNFLRKYLEMYFLRQQFFKQFWGKNFWKYFHQYLS